MKRNQFVMKESFRLGLTEVYRQMLFAAGVQGADRVVIRPHMNGSAGLELTVKQLDQLRGNEPDGFFELSGHGNSGLIETIFEGGETYAATNRPTLTDEERAAKSSKGTGKGIDREAAAARKRKIEELNARIARNWGVVAGGTIDTDTDDESEDDSEE